MTPERSELKHLLDFAVQLAAEAGDITYRHFKGSFVAERKADKSFVTIADREAERFLRASIEQSFPDDGILGEEEGEKVGTSQRRWIIDPVDGTYSFVHAVPLYAVLIGLEIDGESVLGAVNLPALNELVYAARGTWGDAYGHVLVATGRADIMLDPVMNVWDCAALLPLVEEAGGSFTDWQGKRTIHGGNAISTNALLFDDVMETI